jgi:hypothetical protein
MIGRDVFVERLGTRGFRDWPEPEAIEVEE